MALPKLSVVVKERLKLLGLSQAAAADRIRVPAPNLRQWLTLNRFPAEFLLRLAALAGLSGDRHDLAKSYVFKIADAKRSLAQNIDKTITAAETRTGKDLNGVFELMDERLELLDSSRRLRDTFPYDVAVFFNAMQVDDLYVYWAFDESPFEVNLEHWPQAGRAVAGAVNRGAKLIYLSPGKRTVMELQRYGLYGVMGEFEGAFALFKDRLRSVDPSALLSSKKINSHVLHFPVEGHAYLAAAFKFVVFKQHGHQPRALALLPTGTPGKPLPLHLPLSDRAVGGLVRFASWALGTRNLGHLLPSTNT
jgi:transcriptional regulator with XRE-family HTH domain